MNFLHVLALVVEFEVLELTNLVDDELEEEVDIVELH